MDDKFKALKTVDDLSMLNGHAFEEYLTQLFGDLGYVATKTPGSGDYGIDVVLESPDGKIVVQAKQYSNDVGFDAVKEAHFGQSFYHADSAWVVCTGGYTPQAKTAADETGVKLVDAEELQRYMNLARRGGSLVNFATEDERFSQCAKIVELTRTRLWRDIEWAYPEDEAKQLKDFCIACIATILYLGTDSYDGMRHEGIDERIDVDWVQRYVPYDRHTMDSDKILDCVWKVCCCSNQSVFVPAFGGCEGEVWVFLTKLEATIRRTDTSSIEREFESFRKSAVKKYRAFKRRLNDAYAKEDERFRSMSTMEKLEYANDPALPKIRKLKDNCATLRKRRSACLQQQASLQRLETEASTLDDEISDLESSKASLERELAEITGLFKGRAKRAKQSEVDRIASQIGVKQRKKDSAAAQAEELRSESEKLPEIEVSLKAAEEKLAKEAKAAASHVKVKNKFVRFRQFVEAEYELDTTRGAIRFADAVAYEEILKCFDSDITDNYKWANSYWASFKQAPIGEIENTIQISPKARQALDQLGMVDVMHTKQGDVYFAFGETPKAIIAHQELPLKLNEDITRSNKKHIALGEKFESMWIESTFKAVDVRVVLGLSTPQQAIDVCKTMVNIGRWEIVPSSESVKVYRFRIYNPDAPSVQPLLHDDENDDPKRFLPKAESFEKEWPGETFKSVDVRILLGLDSAQQANKVCTAMVDLGRWEVVPSVETVRVYRVKHHGDF